MNAKARPVLRPRKAPRLDRLEKWLSRRVERHENWETDFFGMEWERHDAEEEWAWHLYFRDPVMRMTMARGNTHVKGAIDNFFVSEIRFRRPAWQALDNTGIPGNVQGWMLVDRLLQLSAFNVQHNGINWLSVLSGQIEKLGGESCCMPSFYFRPFGSWWSTAKHRTLATWDGTEDGCEYLRPIPLSDKEKDGEPYVDSELVFEYIDADEIMSRREV